jgi:hypothetical protein
MNRYAMGLAAALFATPAVTAAETGLTYRLLEADVAAQSFEDVPPDYDGATVRHVEQGSEFTALWSMRDGAVDTDPAKATFARGERRMGLFVPFRDLDKPSAEAEGWQSFGRAVQYDVFDVEIARGDSDRTVAGEQARHYTVEAELVYRMGDNPNGTRHLLESDLWLIPGRPYSEAPFAVDRGYGDPRLAAAMAEGLGEVGLVARVHSRYSEQPVNEAGEPLDQPRPGTHMAWIADLSQGAIQDIAPPVVTPETFDALRQASRARPREDCATILAGGTPDFVRDGLASEAHAAFLAGLAPSCARAFPDLAAE